MRRTDVTVLVHLRLLPEFVEQGAQDLLDFVRIVKRYEPDCYAIEIAQDLDDPTRISMIEKWSSRGAYEGQHQKTQHMKSFVERSSRYFDGPPVISFCQGTTIGQASVRGAAPYGR
jgi:quinol monooxygenase YgiN